MKHRAFTLIEAIVIAMILAILAAILFPVFSHPYLVSPRSNCQSNLKQIGLGFWQYTEDYDDRFPAVAASGGWAMAAQPYIKSWQIFHCPSANSGGAERITDYFTNSRLACTKRENIEDPGISILAGDGMARQLPNSSLSQLPAKWRADKASPAWRHIKMANYLFADGHVKSIKPAKITLDKPRAGHPTFLLGWSR